jgi:fatty acid desaturase
VSPTDAVLNYVLFTALAGPYAGVVFLGNHDTDTGGAQELPFLRGLLADTRNLGDTRWDDLLFGGINHHVEHHLYPAIPRARLRTARAIVRDFCTREDLPYREVPSRGAVRLISARFAEGVQS